MRGKRGPWKWNHPWLLRVGSEVLKNIDHNGMSDCKHGWRDQIKKRRGVRSGIRTTIWVLCAGVKGVLFVWFNLTCDMQIWTPLAPLPVCKKNPPQTQTIRKTDGIENEGKPKQTHPGDCGKGLSWIVSSPTANPRARGEKVGTWDDDGLGRRRELGCVGEYGTRRDQGASAAGGGTSPPPHRKADSRSDPQGRNKMHPRRPKPKPIPCHPQRSKSRSKSVPFGHGMGGHTLGGYRIGPLIRGPIQVNDQCVV